MIAEKLKEAGYPIARNMLHVAAVECLRLANGEVAKAVPPFLLRMRKDNELLLELVRPMLASSATAYLKCRSEEMKSGGNASCGHGRVAQQGQSPSAAVNSSGVGHEAVARNGRTINAQPPLEPEFDDGEGQQRDADKAGSNVPPVREPPVTLTEAGRILQKGRPPGAGALQAHAYETRAAVRGESWLLSYAIPGGPLAISLRAGELIPMAERMAKEGGEKAFAAVTLRALHAEVQALANVSQDQVIGKTLPPSAVARAADRAERERAMILRKVKSFIKDTALNSIEGE